MEKVYQRINWNTNGCNGSMDSDRYLHTQIARAICQAAYEKPLTVEEISACTGIPAMYVEDEIPRLTYGEALRGTGNKYVTDFIVLHLADRAGIEKISESMIKETADRCEEILWGRDAEIEKKGFHGCEMGMERLGYIFVPYLLRKRIRDLKNNRLNLPDGDFPPRKDGGYGWFHIEETPDEREQVQKADTGCNCYSDEQGFGYYYWITKYHDYRVYHDGGLEWMLSKGIVKNSPEGVIPENMLIEDDYLRLLEANLIRKGKKGYELNFACFTRQQFQETCALFPSGDEKLDALLCERILTVRKEFEKFVPKHLHAQINQWVSCFSIEIASHVVEELIQRGRLAKPDPEKVLVDGVFYVEGDSLEA